MSKKSERERVKKRFRDRRSLPLLSGTPEQLLARCFAFLGPGEEALVRIAGWEAAKARLAIGHLPLLLHEGEEDPRVRAILLRVPRIRVVDLRGASRFTTDENAWGIQHPITPDQVLGVIVLHRITPWLGTYIFDEEEHLLAQGIRFFALQGTTSSKALRLAWDRYERVRRAPAAVP